MVQYFQNLDELVSLVYQFESQETCGFQVQPSNKISLDKIALDKNKILLRYLFMKVFNATNGRSFMFFKNTYVHNQKVSLIRAFVNI